MRILRCFSNEAKDTEQDVDKYGGINYVIMQRKNTIFRAYSKKKNFTRHVPVQTTRFRICVGQQQDI